MAQKAKVAKPQGLGEKYLEFTIDPQGAVTVEAHGYKDGTCRLATENFEKALGAVQSRKIKDQACAQGVKVKSRN